VGGTSEGWELVISCEQGPYATRGGSEKEGPGAGELVKESGREA